MTAIADVQKRTVLVTGGTGKTGKRVVQRLQAQCIPVRIGARNAGTGFDWNDPESWARAVDGVSAVYLSYSPDLALPGAAETVEAFARFAAERGVRRLVLLSGRGEEGARHAEELFMALGEETGAACTVLRASWFFQNFSESFLAEAVQAGHVALPVGAMREPFIDAEDIAEVAVRVLTQEGHAGKRYELTGPRLFTFAEAVEAIARATGRDIPFQEISVEDFISGLEAEEVPQPFIVLLEELFTQVFDGRNEYLSNGVEDVLGRPPRDFSSYLGVTVATGVWNTPQPALSA